MLTGRRYLVGAKYSNRPSHRGLGRSASFLENGGYAVRGNLIFDANAKVQEKSNFFFKVQK